MQERVIGGKEILQKLDYKGFLNYGIPLSTIPYRCIASFEDDGSDEAPVPAWNLVEKEKEDGRPGAFVFETFDYEKNNWVYEVWSWAD